MLKHKIQTIFEALLYIMLTYWLIDAFFAFNKYDWMLESGGNICSIPSVSGEDRILQAMIAAFFLLTPLIILILRKLFMRECSSFGYMYFRSVFVWFVVGGFFGDGLYFAISKIYESRFNGSHRQRSYQLTFASNPPCSAFPNSTFMPCNLAIRWTIDSPSPLPVAVCPGGR